jgi:23S rRNA pseudouridine1911/1915/1917 synthase
VSSGGPRTLTFQIEASAAGTRVDRLVAELVETTRAEARELCRAGAVRLDGRRVDKGARAAAGATLEVDVAATEYAVAEPELPLDVLLERADLVVVDKPAGMPTVPLARGERGTLAGALLARYPEMRGVGRKPREPGVLHRLDTRTSGVVVAARDATTFERLLAGLNRGLLEKKYLAVCRAAGLDAAGVVDLPLCPDPDNYGRVIVAPPGTSYRQECLTRYRVLDAGARFALVELTVSRAFRHQIRVHLAALGHPIAGDREYGGADVPELGPRHALHASYVAWAGDLTATFAVESAAPRVFRELVRATAEP